jgi:hypothetical protein
MTPREKQLMALRKAKALRRQENKVLRKKKRFSKSPRKPKVTMIPLARRGSLRYKLDLPTKYSSLSGERKSAVISAYICLQRERCWLCGDSLYELPTFIVENPKLMALSYNELAEEHPHHLHHDHDTGLTLGVTHAECNIMSGITYELEDR